MEAFLGVSASSEDGRGSAHSAGPLPWPAVPGYEILEELGRGGMGVVYKARQLGLERLVALKMIRPPNTPLPEQLARFRAEGRAVAQLEHPGIVQIYEIGEYQGQPFFSLQYVAGGSLAGRIQGRAWAPRPAARLVADLAAAVQHAHARGVVHRDLKPANVLLAADGSPRITDFGVAKLLQSEGPGLTAVGAVFGSPAYMPPEQARGDAEAVGPKADIFGLGAILYELLTGSPLYQGETLSELVERAQQARVTPPRQLNPAVPRELEHICLKALAADPAQRYASAAELERHLRRWLGQPRRIGVAVGMVAALVLVLAAVLAIRGIGLPTVSPAGSGVVPPVQGVAEPALTGELIVTVFEKGKTPRRVDRTGVLPVRTGEGVHVEARLDRPGYVYLLAIDEEGGVAPLYPWPWGQQPAPTLADPPPREPPLATIHSPRELDQGWDLKGEGMQTVLLLARGTPLPPERKLADLLGPLRPTPLANDNLREVVVRGFQGGRMVAPVDLHRRFGAEKVQMDGTLEQMIERLRQDFETIWAVRFALKSQ
jgi:hypothetical protein